MRLPDQAFDQSTTMPRRLPAGAEITTDGRVHFRVWAPRRSEVAVQFETQSAQKASALLPLTAEGNGYFSGCAEAGKAGDLYWFRLDGDSRCYPDPASRFQPQGPHGPSQIVDPAAFKWHDGTWPGISRDGQVLYELHVGTFTREGTWVAAQRELRALAALGITAIEVMPVAEFPGAFGWGYDGVDLYAPSHLYGTPDDFRRFVDHAHACGLGVLLDVVYNHFGPDGCFLREFAADYFTSRYDNEWGDAVNFDGEGADGVREFIVANAHYWIEEFHLDGLRLDATQQMFDGSRDHVIASIARAVRAAAGARSVLIVAENEPQDTLLVRSAAAGGYGLDAIWNDDFHHATTVAATGRNEAYYTDYAGSAQELLSAAKWGFLYQGQRYKWQKKPRGTPAWGMPPSIFVNFLQNHDQIANSFSGERLHRLTSSARYRALTAFLLLAPGTPMLFQGQEFAASAPFLFFADHRPDLAEDVRQGRAEFLAQFPALATSFARSALTDPAWDPLESTCRHASLSIL